ncbi:hypothetical protein [Chryseobacterium scophthalmum]|uniref:hypothetical protein n=1 Tax=Chryseobacterium scophthalmum TaxID=59733 RepID=UPI000C9E27C4|nr:hypothetical protein [Chryseobacterium scophthalmum]
MKTVRINSQNHVIDLITQALDETSLGLGLKHLSDIEYIKQEDSTTIVFERKDGEEFNPSDFLFLGYFVGRDFEKCTICEEKQKSLIKNIQSKKKH